MVEIIYAELPYEAIGIVLSARLVVLTNLRDWRPREAQRMARALVRAARAHAQREVAQIAA